MKRVYLFLQGPHGPFFGELARHLTARGARCLRLGINRGDEAFWPDADSYHAHAGPLADIRETIEALGQTEGVTDLVLYGDTRPHHRAAIEALPFARRHVFEEGYLRPYWITYERDGANGNSRLMSLSLPEIEAAIGEHVEPSRGVPAHWGSLWHHSWYGCLYHGNVLLRNGSYPHYQSHRGYPVGEELAHHVRRLMSLPGQAALRRRQTRRLLARGRPFHVALLQLGHDASLRDHSDFRSMADFVTHVTDAFAAGAPGDHELVFKAHPLEDGREGLRDVARRAAKRAGIADRVHYHHGGKLADLVDFARSAVTVNSTAAQQILWRGLPLKAFGRAIYSKPGFVSDQTLDAFFANPAAPDSRAYRRFRAFLLATSQVPGGFYTKRARALALRRVTDMMHARLRSL